MIRGASAAALGAVIFLAGCADRVVDLPIDRQPAVVVRLAEGPARCPVDTVAYLEDDPQSGAGRVPADFDARTVLRCEIDYSTMRSRDGIDRFTVNQWRSLVTSPLRAAFDLPDRGFEPARACAASTGSVTAVYLVDAHRRAVRVQLPREAPCQQIRADVSRLLYADVSPLDDTFHASRKGT